MYHQHHQMLWYCEGHIINQKCVQLNWETVGILGHRCKGYFGARFRSQFELWGQKDFMFVEKILHSLFMHKLFNVQYLKFWITGVMAMCRKEDTL